MVEDEEFTLHTPLLAPVGAETRTQVKRTEKRLQKERKQARADVERLEQELRELRQQVQVQGGAGGEDVAEGPGEQDGEEPRPRAKNLKQQSVGLSTFDGHNLKEDGPTIADWCDEFDTLATLCEWIAQECLVVQVSKLKGAALKVEQCQEERSNRFENYGGADY